MVRSPCPVIHAGGTANSASGFVGNELLCSTTPCGRLIVRMLAYTNNTLGIYIVHSLGN